MKWWIWLAVLIAVGAVGIGVQFFLLVNHGPRTATVVGWIFTAVELAWAAWGFWIWRQVRWVQTVAVLLVGTIVVLALTATLAYSRYSDWAIGLLGVWGMIVAFGVGLWLIRLVLFPGHPILGVARTLVDEAIRMKIALIFILLMVLMVPILPLMLDRTERLTYRISSFLSWSLLGTMYLLSLMTIFLACGTITSEISRRQIFLTMTKPVSRANYLLGKWLGITLLNLLLLTVAGGGIYAFTRILANPGLAQTPTDWTEVQTQVLVARAAVGAQPPEGLSLQTMYQDRLRELQQAEPTKYGDPEKGEQPSLALQREIQNQIVNRWHAIEPGAWATFRFEGLSAAKQFGDRVQLRFKPQMTPTPPDEKVVLGFVLNDRPYPVNPVTGEPVAQAVAANNFHVMDLPVEAIDDNGVLEVGIANATFPVVTTQEGQSVTFTPGTGIEVLYQVDRFTPNLIRGLLMIWFGLIFLAILGLAAGTFLGFPVACMLSLVVFFAASASTFLAESLVSYGGVISVGEGSWMTAGLWTDIRTSFVRGEYFNLFKIFVRIIGQLFVALIPSLGAYDPVPLVSDGRVVPSRMVASSAIWVAVVWSGVVALVAWLIFRRRELARVTV